jgi:hypothetical protein
MIIGKEVLPPEKECYRRERGVTAGKGVLPAEKRLYRQEIGADASVSDSHLF